MTGCISVRNPVLTSLTGGDFSATFQTNPEPQKLSNSRPGGGGVFWCWGGSGGESRPGLRMGYVHPYPLRGGPKTPILGERRRIFFELPGSKY